MIHTHYPARGRKHEYLKALGVQTIKDSYPLPRKGTETGKYHCPPPSQSVNDSYPLPRKGTETRFALSPCSLGFPWIHTHYPARGRKQLLLKSLSQLKQRFIPTTPQGDGNHLNPVYCLLTLQVSRDSYPLPRKGTETLTGNWRVKHLPI